MAWEPKKPQNMSDEIQRLTLRAWAYRHHGQRLDARDMWYRDRMFMGTHGLRYDNKLHLGALVPLTSLDATTAFKLGLLSTPDTYVDGVIRI